MPCANGYVSYDVMSYQICLKYYPVPVTYESARALCQTEGADLIKIDSQEKFDVFKDYHGMLNTSNNCNYFYIHPTIEE